MEHGVLGDEGRGEGRQGRSVTDGLREAREHRVGPGRRPLQVGKVAYFKIRATL